MMSAEYCGAIVLVDDLSRSIFFSFVDADFCFAVLQLVLRIPLVPVILSGEISQKSRRSASKSGQSSTWTESNGSGSGSLEVFLPPFNVDRLNFSSFLRTLLMHPDRSFYFLYF